MERLPTTGSHGLSRPAATTGARAPATARARASRMAREPMVAVMAVSSERPVGQGVVQPGDDEDRPGQPREHAARPSESHAIHPGGGARGEDAAQQEHRHARARGEELGEGEAHGTLKTERDGEPEEEPEERGTEGHGETPAHEKGPGKARARRIGPEPRRETGPEPASEPPDAEEGEP